MITQENARKIELNHNVHVDRARELYTHGDKKSNYGWEIIPPAWIEKEEKNEEETDWK